jgi:hypothetical protein
MALARQRNGLSSDVPNFRSPELASVELANWRVLAARPEAAQGERSRGIGATATENGSQVCSWPFSAYASGMAIKVFCGISVSGTHGDDRRR